MNRLRQRLYVRALEDRTAPATFTVMNLADSGADSLRDCVSKANAAAGADTINFNVGLTGTIMLTTGEIAISQAVTIIGPGSSLLAVSGNNLSRIINTEPSPASALINLSGLTLAAGKDTGFLGGGAIYGFDEFITLDKCAFTGNSTSAAGGAISLGNSTLVASNTSFISNTSSSNGGAIVGLNKITLQNCFITGNQATGSGAIFVNNYLLVNGSTISGNTAANGGGIFATSSTLTDSFIIRNSTISGNSASGLGGGIGASNFVTLKVQNCTITGNTANSGGGVLQIVGTTGTVSIESSVVSGNSASFGPDISSGSTVNVKTSAVGSALGFTKTDKGGNLAFQPHANLKLGALADNGGATLTHLPAPDSPLINVGSNPAGLSTDQRGVGFPRAIGGLVDIGAVEDLTLVVRNSANSGPGSLRQTVLDANSLVGPNTITFDPTVFATPQTITMAGTEMTITDSVTIAGPNAALTINAVANSRHFDIDSPPAGKITVSISAMTLINGNAGASLGGAIAINEADVILSKLVLSGNKAATNGGAIGVFLSGSNITLVDCTLSGNSATGSSASGGGVAASPSGTLTMLRCNVTGNTSGEDGGGVYVPSGMLIMDDCTVSGNKSNTVTFDAGGGGIRLTAANATIRNSTVSGNSASKGGGLAMFNSTTVLIQNCTIADNSATTDGGGIRIGIGLTLHVDSSIINKNTGTVGPDVTGIVQTMNTCLVSNSSGLTINSGSGNLLNVDAKLGSLANNGGPTQTHALLTGSPAINAGNNSALLTNDQRGSGFPRVNDSVADIGAYESKLQVFVVTNDNNSGAGSLRQAVLDANANAGTDTIAFDPAFFNIQRSIVLSSGVMTISDPVNINGPGASLLNVSGNLVSQIFNTVSAPTGAAISISGMSLVLGQAASQSGGAIDSGDEHIYLSQCDFTLNNSQSQFGGAVSIVQGSLTATDCSFIGNKAPLGGGAIRLVGGSALIQRCTFSINESDTGGAIDLGNTSSVVIEDSTLSSNVSHVKGGGAINALITSGGPGALTIRNSTISGNSAAVVGGGVSLEGTIAITLTVQNSTIVFNIANSQGGGISTNFPMTMESSILFGNQSPIGPDAVSNSSTTVSTSLIGSTSGMVNITADTFTNAKIGVNPLLGPLAKNGGPTQTRALLTGSPAINNGSNPAGLANDQRGFSRVFGTAIDIGAFESQLLTLTVDVLADENDGNFAKGDLSLREAVFIANSNPGVDTITFDAAAFGSGQPIILTLGELGFSESATVVGLGTGKVVIDADYASRVFSMKAAPGNSNFTIENLTVKGGTATTGGGIYAWFNNLNLNNCVISGNKATQLGAGVDIVGTLTATNCLFTLNSGGASAIRALGTAILTQCTISGNSAFRGAGLSMDGFLTVDSCTISGNTATGSTGGGGVYQKSSLFSSFRNTTISGNTAASGMGGGVLFAHAGTFPDFQNCTITNNSAATGGAIASKLGSGIIDLVSSIVSGNTATVGGPDMYTPGAVNAVVSLMGTSAGMATFTPDSFTTTNLGKAPLLGSLGNNGGPTMTHALQPGSPAINNGSNPAALTNDQRGIGFLRSSGVTDIGAFEVQLVPAKITSVQINDGSAQRSRITSLTITFDQPPTLPTNFADGFQLKRQSDNAAVTLSAVPSGNTVTLTFMGGVPFESGSLADGRYTLTALASQIANLDGNGDSNIGDDYMLASAAAPNPPTNIFRLFGDITGDGTGAANDFIQFRLFFNGVNAAFDFDGDGSVSASDFVQFRLRFNGSI